METNDEGNEKVKKQMNSSTRFASPTPHICGHSQFSSPCTHSADSTPHSFIGQCAHTTTTASAGNKSNKDQRQDLSMLLMIQMDSSCSLFWCAPVEPVSISFSPIASLLLSL